MAQMTITCTCTEGYLKFLRVMLNSIHRNCCGVSVLVRLINVDKETTDDILFIHDNPNLNPPKFHVALHDMITQNYSKIYNDKKIQKIAKAIILSRSIATYLGIRTIRRTIKDTAASKAKNSESVIPAMVKLKL